MLISNQKCSSAWSHNHILIIIWDEMKWQLTHELALFPYSFFLSPTHPYIFPKTSFRVSSPLPQQPIDLWAWSLAGGCVLVAARGFLANRGQRSRSEIHKNFSADPRNSADFPEFLVIIVLSSARDHCTRFQRIFQQPGLTPEWAAGEFYYCLHVIVNPPFFLTGIGHISAWNRSYAASHF